MASSCNIQREDATDDGHHSDTANAAKANKPMIPPVPSNFLAPDPTATLPIANITRLMKSNLPEHAKISSPARDALLACVVEMIGFITSEANAKSNLEKRKTVNGDDVLFALNQLGFDNYHRVLTVFLARYREMTFSNLSSDPDSHAAKGKRRSKGPKKKSAKSFGSDGEAGQDEQDDEQDQGQGDDGQGSQDDEAEQGNETDGSMRDSNKTARDRRGTSGTRARARGRKPRGRPPNQPLLR